MEVVSENVGDVEVSGKFTYIKKNQGRPAYRHDSIPTLCLFYSHHWKVDNCANLLAETKGFLFSQGSDQLYPNETGPTWRNVREEASPPDASIVVKCESK